MSLLEDISTFFIQESGEIWQEKKPLYGDHIRVDRGLYTHHGIYCSDQEIVHFSGIHGDNVLDWEQNEIIRSPLTDFLRDGVLEVRVFSEDEKLRLHTPSEIIKRAYSSLGKQEYHLIHNNCEHFCNYCTLGENESTQINQVFESLDEIINNKLPELSKDTVSVLDSMIKEFRS